MKNLLLILILANVLYFLWGLTSRDETRPGVAILSEEDLGPPLVPEPATGEDASESDDVEGDDGEADEQPELVAVVGRACVTIGPLRERSDAEEAEMRYSGQDMKTAVRTGTGEFFVGHWVQIRDVASDEQSREMIETLHGAGLTDAYPVETEDEGRKISLGLFGDPERAERVREEALELGLPADISPRMSEREAYWVDLALPPARGAGEIIRRYGEDMVKLRGEATCPR